MFNIGDKVIKSDKYVPNEFDAWGRGEGIGEIVGVEYDIDVRWPTGKCYEDADQIQLVKRAACAVIIKKGKVLSVSRKDNINIIGLPGGKVDPGEDYETAIIREVLEETGYHIEIIRELQEDMDNGYLTKTFLCRIIKKDSNPIQEKETGLVAFKDYSKFMSKENSIFHEYNAKLYPVIKELLEPKTAKITLECIKSHGWYEVGLELNLSAEESAKAFEHGEYGSVELIIDENLNIVGGKVIPTSK